MSSLFADSDTHISCRARTYFDWCENRPDEQVCYLLPSPLHLCVSAPRFLLTMTGLPVASSASGHSNSHANEQIASASRSSLRLASTARLVHRIIPAVPKVAAARLRPPPSTSFSSFAASDLHRCTACFIIRRLNAHALASFHSSSRRVRAFRKSAQRGRSRDERSGGPPGEGGGRG